MTTSFWSQIDIRLGELTTRILMSDCGGKDQVVRAVRKSGWQGYEPPLPLLTVRKSYFEQSVFIDVGANTGYYSLLAAASGASHVWAFEPIPAIRSIFTSNVVASELTQKITISEYAVSDVAGQFEMYLPDAGHGLIETSA